MTDRYERIREALALLCSRDYCERATGYSKLRNACDPGTTRELLAERDALREALEMMVEMVEMDGFGRDYAMDVARAVLARGKGGHA